MSKQDVQDLQQKYRPTTKIKQYISLYTWGTILSLCSPNPSGVFAAKKLLVSSDHGSMFLDELAEFFPEILPNNMW